MKITHCRVSVDGTLLRGRLFWSPPSHHKPTSSPHTPLPTSRAVSCDNDNNNNSIPADHEFTYQIKSNRLTTHIPTRKTSPTIHLSMLPSFCASATSLTLTHSRVILSSCSLSLTQARWLMLDMYLCKTCIHVCHV